MAKTPKTLSREELVQQLADARAELKFGKHIKVSETATPIALSLIRWVAIVACFGFVYLSIDSLAGKQTDAVINLKMLLNSNFLGVIFGSGGIIYGYAQKKLRQKVIARLQPRIQHFEQLMDPTRSSSLLTEHGNTNPDDE